MQAVPGALLWRYVAPPQQTGMRNHELSGRTLDVLPTG